MKLPIGPHPIPGFEKYAITPEGVVHDLEVGAIRKEYLQSKGYPVVLLNGKGKLVSRLMGATYLGLLPHQQMDHINGNKRDNHLSNLRVCTFAQNQQNKGLHRNNRSGQVGVYWVKTTHRWAAKIEANKVRHFLGFFKSFDEAVAAYQGAAALHHGEFRSTRR